MSMGSLRIDMSIRGFVDAVEPSPTTVRIRTPDPSANELGHLRNLIEKTFADPQITVQVERVTTPEGGPVVAVTDEDGAVLATSRLQDVGETLLLVNEDLYVTGARRLEEVRTPEAVLALDETTFTVRGKSKFLLIHLSRHIESLAHETGAGELHTCFQHLSRVRDERGTERVYRRLADTGLDLHLYGVDDTDGPLDLSAVVHDQDLGELSRSWFVVHDGDGEAERKAALVAIQTAGGAFNGYWTFDPDRVDDVLDYLKGAYGEEGTGAAGSEEVGADD